VIGRNQLVSIVLLIAGALAGFFISRGAGAYLAIEYRAKDLSATGGSPVKVTGPVDTLPLRMVDMGGVGVLPDTLNWGHNYEHNQHVFEDVILQGPPYIDRQAFDREKAKLERYAGHMSDMGFNAISMPWFLECVNFSRLGDGYRVYSMESPYRARHDTLSARFGELMESASGYGLDTYLWTDMVALTSPLRSYLFSEIGSLDTEEGAFWEVYELAAEEAFEKFPRVKGIIIRIGEAGTVYNKPGWDYTSELLVRTPEAVNLMLAAFLRAAEKYDRTIVFRTWSVGVGAIGDMHTRPDTYRRILGNISSPNLVVSTKYCRGDFYSWLETNPTLMTGTHRRIIEFQAKREFEGFGALPNYVAPLHQSALVDIITGNPAVEGAWVWTQYGGPLRAGPQIIYPFFGFNVINDANVFALGKLLTHPRARLDSITAVWIRDYFGSDSMLVADLTVFLNSSHEVLKHGLYISDFSRYDVKALGLEPPPMLWIFEWDILGGSSAVFSNIYFLTRDRFDAVVAEGTAAVEGASALKELLVPLRVKVARNRADFDALIAATGYEVDLLTMLAHYRKYFMHYFRWLDTGNSESLGAWQLAMGQFRADVRHLQERYAGSPDVLGMDLEEAVTGMKIAGNTGHAVRWARVALILAIFILLLGIPGFTRDRAHLKFSGTLQFQAIFQPYRIHVMESWHSSRALLFFQLAFWIFSLVVFSSFTSWLFPLAVGVSGLVYILVLARMIGPGRNPEQVLIGLMAPKVLLMMVLLGVVAFRGAMYFWFRMWIPGPFRAIFFTVWMLLLFRKFQVHLVLAEKWGRNGKWRAAAKVLTALGIQILTAGAALAFFGLEDSLTALNNDLLVLPSGLSKILGITTHLGIPLQLPLWILSAGLALTLATATYLLISYLLERKRTPRSRIR